MLFFVGSVILFFILCFYAYRYYFTDIGTSIGKVKLNKIFVISFFVLGFLLRVFISARNSGKGYNGFDTDISCFTAWSRHAFEDGLSNFYTSDMYTDYPPGFVYVFYLIGAIAKLLGLQEGTTTYVILLKLPAMISDIGIAVCAYMMSREMKVSKFSSLFMSFLIIMNPLVLIDSAVWGQTDSVFVFLLVLAFCFFYRKKNIPAYFIYGAAILMKPQSLIFAPVVIFAYINAITANFKDKKKFVNDIMIHTGTGLAAIASVFLLMVPFGVTVALKQYTETLKSYPYGSVNAYNLYGLAGKIWIGQDETLLGIPMKLIGTISIVLMLIAATYIFIRMRKSKSVYFLTATFIIFAMFTLSVRMHERYIYPAAIFLLFTYIMRPKTETFILFVANSVISFFNAFHVLYYYDPENFDRANPIIKTVSLMEILSFAFLVYIVVKYYTKPEDEKAEQKGIDKMIKSNNDYFERIRQHKTYFKFSEKIAKMTKVDYIIVTVIMVLYSCVAFYHLGDMDAPHTEYSLVNEGSITIDLGEPKQVSEMWVYLGHEFDQDYWVSYSTDDETWYSLYTVEDPWQTGSVYNWNKTEVDIFARYIHIEPVDENRNDCVIEMVLKDPMGNILEPVNKDRFYNLFDEQQYAVTEDTYLNGTYFDEVHYTRHIYEMKNGLYTYENTHPQLGKEIMSLGTFIFGMNPFGWRFSGTVCGIIMIFAMYVFAKKFFRDTKLATLTTVVFTSDFMHFVQSRIATIDVYAVMFIMLSFIFIYEYTQLNFYDTPLRKTYRPLFLCGLFAGLAIASKWIGVYSAAGIAVLLFIMFVYRYREYALALKRVETDFKKGSDFDIVRVFNRRLIKTVLWCVLVFIIIPLFLYTLTYIPFNDGVEGRSLISKMLNAQKTMFNYHTNITSTHPYSSEWYQWPVMTKPVLFVFEMISDTSRRVITLLGNPAIWWLGIPASLYMIYLWLNERDRKAGFLLVGYLAQYLPWLLVERYVFIYHYFASVPFITVMVIYSLQRLGKRFPKIGNKPIYVYAAICVLLFILFLPILNGSEVTVDYITHFLKWSKDWAM